MSGVNRIARGAWMLSALGLLVGAYACAAPDAKPGRATPADGGIDATSGSGGDGGGGSGAGGQDAEPPKEPVAGVPLWAKGYGSTGNVDQRAFDVALGPTPDSVVATMWFYQSTLGLDPVGMYTATNTSDVVVAKFGISDKGTPEWARHIKSDGGVIRSVVEVDAKGNTIVAGGFYGFLTIDALMPPKGINFDAYFAKFNSAGEPVWVQTFGDDNHQIITDVAIDGSGNIIVVGVTEGAAYKFGMTSVGGELSPPPIDSMAPTKDDLFVAKFDPDGKIIWANRFGTAGNRNDGPQLGEWHDPVVTVAASTSGAIIVGGAFSQSATFGATKVTAKGTDDGFVTKLDADGNTLWHVTFGNTSRVQRVRSVAFTSTDEVLFVGSVHGKVDIDGVELQSYQDSEDALVAKLSKDGKVVWANGYGLLGKQQATTVLLDGKDQPIVFGTFVGAIDFAKNGGAIVDTTVGNATDLFMAKFSASGTPFWARRYGDIDSVGVDNQDMGGATLAKDGDKDVAIVAGMNRSSMDLTPLPPLKTAGYEDVFLMSVTY